MDEIEQDSPGKEKGDQAAGPSEAPVEDGHTLPAGEADQPQPSQSDPQLSLWPPDAAPSGSESSIPGDSLPPLPGPPPRPDAPFSLRPWIAFLLLKLRYVYDWPAAPWSLRDLLLFILFAASSFVLANVLAVLLFLAVRSGFHLRITIEQALLQTPWVVAMQTGWELLWLVFIYFTVSKKYDRRFWEALKWIKGPHPVGTYLAAGAALAFVAQGVLNLFPSHKHLPIEKLFSSTGAAYLLAFFGICVAPFVEELVFRGFFYPVFEKLWGLMAAVILTALLFAAIHAPQLSGGRQEIAMIFIVGMVFSYCRGKTGSLVPPYLMHLAYNTSLFVSLYFSTDRFRNLKG